MSYDIFVFRLCPLIYVETRLLVAELSCQAEHSECYSSNQ